VGARVSHAPSVAHDCPQPQERKRCVSCLSSGVVTAKATSTGACYGVTARVPEEDL
jgi:hypothetical protein